MDESASIPWGEVWVTAGELLRLHLHAGRAHLLTEDTLRFASVVALDEVGVDADRLVLEWPAPELAKGKLDLVVDAGTSPVVVEFKFPRDARGPISPDTMTFGSLLNDFHRVSRVPAVERWVVQLLNGRLLRYLERVAQRYPVPWVRRAGDTFELAGHVVQSLPKTARDNIHGWPLEDTVVAHCEHAALLPEDLTLTVFRVEPQPYVKGPLPRPSVEEPPQKFSATAREELLSAADALIARTGNDQVRKQDLIDEALRRGSRHKKTTLSQMISVHLCVQPGREGYGQYADFERVGHGLYRLRKRQ